VTTESSEIFEAIAAGNLDRVRTLIAEDSALAGARDAQALHTADGGRLVVQELVDGDAALTLAFSPDGFTALHLTAFFGHPDIARLLVERGADTNAVARNPMQVMPLHSAAAARQLEIAELLVDHGADVNASQERGFTPLHEAAQNGDVELARLLLERGADREPAAEDGRRAADFASAGGHEEVLALLGNGELG
jgi:ankyrin repeat protein